MGEGNNGDGVDDIFSGNGNGKTVATAIAEPADERGHSGPSLERTIGGENVHTMPPDIMQDLTGGYSPEAHRDTLDKVRKARKDRAQLEQEADKYWKNNDRAIAEAMGIAPGTIMSYVYGALGHVGVNMYKRDAHKAMGKLRSETNRIQSDVDRFQVRLEGKVQYVPPIAGQSSEESLEQRKYVRETDKGLRYKLAESTDEARILGYQYRNGLRALGQYRQKIAAIDADIESLQSNTQDPTASAKISNLQSERTNILREKEVLEQTQREYEQELVAYEKKVDRLQAKVSFYDVIIRKGNNKIRQMESAIDILDDYIRERDDLVSVNDLLNDLRNLDEKHAQVNSTIEKYDGIVGDQLDHLSHVVQNNDVEYNNRPLMQQVGQMTKEDQVATQKDMGRILGKLGISV